jgi:cation diffusion facilitator family transporter
VDNSSKKEAVVTVRSILKWILILNLFVAGVKFFIGFKASSLSIIGDAVHSGIDSLNNVIALVMIKLASEPPDKNHPYGHSKFETLGALAVVAFLAIASFALIEKSIIRFLNPGDFPRITNLVIYLLIVTLVINIFVWLYEKNAAKRFNSAILAADAEHTFSDILITISILTSVFFIARGYLWLDPLLGLVIAAVIIKSGIEILQQTVPILVDSAWLVASDIQDLVMTTPKVISYSNLRSRKVYDEAFLEMNVRFDTDSLQEAHELSHEIENRIIDKYGPARITIHIEPARIAN